MKKLKIIHGSNKFGVSISNYENLLNKCRQKFPFLENCELRLSYEDGTEIDEDFFPALEDGDTLHLHTRDATEKLISSATHSFEAFIRHCLALEPNISDQLQAVIASGRVSDLHEFIASRPVVPEEARLSLRSEHPQWFEGVGSRQHCKEAVLRGSAECRMRGYFQHVQRELRGLVESKEDEDQDSLASRVEQAIAHFKLCLKERRFNASYFDRSHPSACCRLCDTDGQFRCGGEYNHSRCYARHTINPYAARHSRIVFSTWNLDHMIEKSRNVIPALKRVLSTHQIVNINLDYFFDLLFTKYDSQCYASKRRASQSSDQPDGGNKKNKLDDYFQSPNVLAERNSLFRSVASSASKAVCAFASEPRIITGNIPNNSSRQNECIRDNIAMSSKSCCDAVEGSTLRVNARTCKAKLEPTNSLQTHKTNHSKNTASKPTKKTSPSKKLTEQSNSAEALPSCSYVACGRHKLDDDHNPSDHDRPWPGNLKLVHIACHVKLPHDVGCDPQFFYRSGVAGECEH